MMMMINSQFNKQPVKESVTSFWLMDKSVQLYTIQQQYKKICDNDRTSLTEG